MLFLHYLSLVFIGFSLDFVFQLILTSQSRRNLVLNYIFQKTIIYGRFQGIYELIATKYEDFLLRPNQSWCSRVFSGHPYGRGRPYHPPVLCAVAFLISIRASFIKEHTEETERSSHHSHKNRADQIWTTIDSREDLPPQDHPLIHHTPLLY
jgi:hypothetical protein